MDKPNTYFPCKLSSQIHDSQPPDLLSIAGRLAEAARKLLDRPSWHPHDRWKVEESLEFALKAWDAARKDRS